MSTKEISFNDPAPRNIAAPTPTRREGKEVVPSTKLGDDGVSEPTVSIPQDIINALAEDIQQFKDIFFSDPAPGKVAALAWARREGKDVVPSIKHRLGYMMSSKSYAQDLRKEVQNLADDTERVNNAVEKAKNNARNINSHVTDWQASAEKALKEAQDLLGDFEEVSKICCYGTLPSPSFRSQFRREAKDKIEDIQKLVLEGGKFKELYDIFSAPALGNVATPNPARREGKEVVRLTTATASASSASTSIKIRDDGVFESRAKIIRLIMDALADNGNRVVGIYGMGGVGKSTLLVDVERIIRREKSFDLVAKADVSENPDIKMIQGEIADAMGLTEIKDRKNISGRAELLRKRLEQEKKKVLIILDNLWEKLELKSVGIPCGSDNKVTDCKLLLTSRFRDILQSKMGCDKDFRLDKLKEEEAKSLFERMGGDKVHDGPFKSLVDEALRKCAGLPFLIITMAKLFKHAKFSQWDDVLKQIEWSTNRGISERINTMLKLSYDHLEGEEVKSLLQLCVAYDVSEPSLENLMRYSYGWGLFKKDSSIKEARDRLSTLIHTLQASSFLLDNGGADGFKINDLVHDFVARFIFRDHPLLVLKDRDTSANQLQKEMFKSCTTICFSYIDIKELPKELECPELRMFLLFTNNESLEVPDSYFNSMKKLAVLNLTSVRLTCSPTPFQLLENLHTLSLHNCLLDDVAIVGKLKGLQILSFMNSKIELLPKEIGQLAELRLLDLNHCSCLQIIEPGVLGRLIKLEELYMENSFNKWNAVEQTQPTNVSLIELNHMKNLCTLHVCIPDPTMLPEDLNVKKLTKYGIQIGGRCWLSRKGPRTLELQLNPKRDILWKGFIQTALDRTDALYMDELNGIKQSLCELSPEGFPNLKHLHVENSPSVLYILWQPSLPAFRMLELLCLKNLINLEKICHTHVYSKSFGTLKVVIIESCDKMEVLFPLSLVRELPQLEEIRVVHCNLLREIVKADDRGKVELHNLQVLELRDLPNIKNFSIPGMDLLSSTSNDHVSTQVVFFSGQQVVFPSLETLNITGMLNVEMIWDNQVYFQHLKTLDVSHCHQLTNMFTLTIARNLVALTRLRISNCQKLIEVFSNKGGKEEHAVAFNRLKSMELDELSGLRCFSLGGYTLMFPLLEDVIVTRCLNMKFFSKGPIETPKLDKVQVSIDAWFWNENLNMTIQKMYEEMATVAGGEFIRLSTFPELIGKWHDALIPIEPFSKLESLVVDKCPSFVNAIPSKLMLALHNMRILQVCDCESLEEIFDLEGLQSVKSTQVLPRLWHLGLVNLLELRQLWNKNLEGRLCFNSLSHLTLYKCDNLRNLFSPSMIQCFATLEYMEINECGKIEGVIAEEEGHGSVVEKITFPSLWGMVLEHLPNLTSFLSGKNHTLECLDLKWLMIAHCPRMRSFSGKSLMEIDHGSPSLFTSQVAFPGLKTLYIICIDNIEMICDNQVYFQHLKTLEVLHCDRLSYMFTTTIAEKVVELTELRISNCRMLREVISDEVDKESHVGASNQLKNTEPDWLRCFTQKAGQGSPMKTIRFPNLHCVELECLPILTSFLSGNNYTLEWPLLEELTVDNCPKMTRIGMLFPRPPSFISHLCMDK